MFSPYLTQREFYQLYDVSRIISEDKFAGVKGAAAMQVEQDVRARGNNPASLMVPIQLNGDVDQYQQTAITSDTTYDSITPYNANRVVIDISSIGSGEVTFTLEGSRDDSIWRTIKSVVTDRDLSIKTYSDSEETDLFVTKYEYLRLKVETSVSVTFTAFVLDATPDLLTAYKTIVLGSMPYAGNEEADALIADFNQMYLMTLQSLSTDTDTDEDGEIEDGEDDTQPQMIGYR